MSRPRTVLSLLLAVALIAMACVPALAQPPRAGADDSTAFAAKAAKKKTAQRGCARRNRRSARRRCVRRRALGASWTPKRGGLAGGVTRWAGLGVLPTPVPTTAPSAPTAPTPFSPTPADVVLSRRLGVTSKEFNLTLSRPLVGSGSVKVELRNGGEDPHDLVIDDAGAQEVGRFGELAPGAVEDESFELAAGDYTLFCSLNGHRAAGMQATLKVR